MDLPEKSMATEVMPVVALAGILTADAQTGWRTRGPRSVLTLDNDVADRGSKYADSGGPCRSGDEARTFLAEHKRNKRFPG
jgi:hypothetical protein